MPAADPRRDPPSTGSAKPHSPAAARAARFAGAGGRPSLAEIARQWGRIGCVGFGGPPAHIALLREVCVERHAWLTDEQFEQGMAAANLLPGPASTQLAIYCAWRLRGWRGAILGGLSFVLPGLVMILALSALFLSSSPPSWVLGAGMGAGAAVAAVAVRAGLGVAAPIWARSKGARRLRVAVYCLAGGSVAAAAGPGVALALLACGAAELALQRLARSASGAQLWLLMSSPRLPRGPAHGPTRSLLGPLPVAAVAMGGTAALVWTALKVGALAFGGGFVIVPLMQADAVSTYHWMTSGQFLNAVALGQVTPGPVTHTVAAVGYAAGGLAGGLLAALVAFAPSFAFILAGAARFERLLGNARVLAFLAGAAPAAAGAIIGSSIPLTQAIGESWQYLVLAAAAIALFALRRSVVATLLAAAAAGALAAELSAPLTPG
jgi:chromate transporter